MNSDNLRVHLCVDLYFSLHQPFFGTFEKSSEYIICNEVMRFGDVDFT